MSWAPVVVVGGARTCGKTTMLNECADHLDVSILDLDDESVRRLVTQDLAGYLERLPRPVCIDEFQRDIAVLDAIKSELNRGTKPGQFLLTGSTRYTTLPKASQSLTGRAHLMTLWPLSQGELRGHREVFLDAVLNSPGDILSGEASVAGRGDYEKAVVQGGYPMVHMLESETARKRWFRDLVELVVKRDILEVREVRRRDDLVEVLRALAGQTGQILNRGRIASQLSISETQTRELVALLEAVYLVHRLPPFTRTLSARVGRSSKVHLVDTGLGASLLGVNGRRLRTMNPTALTEFGHLVETFAVNELMKQAGWSEEIVDFFHFRSRDKQEVDLVIQADDGRVAAIEVKAGSKVSESDFAGMRMLKEQLGSDFVGGILLNLGKLSYRFEPDMYVMPISTLWTYGAGAD